MEKLEKKTFYTIFSIISLFILVSIIVFNIQSYRKEYVGIKTNLSRMNMMFFGVPTVQAYDSIDAVVNVTVILELLVIGLSLVIVSSLASMISIQRFSTLTILKERS